jgi:ParB-like chromosome segregation protein Spo0J
MTSKDIAEPLHWNKMDTCMVSIPNIEVTNRIIPPTKARVDVMAKRLQERGQLVPILIRKTLASQCRLVAGATRLAAAKQLGWDEIEAKIISADNEFEYGLIEIAENLDRHDLGVSEREKLKAKAKELRAQRLAQFEELLKNPHPAHQEPKPERQHKATGKPKGRPKGGVRDAARKAGVPKSTAQDHAKAISPENENRTKKPQAKKKSKPAPADDMPTEAEAEASHQDTLFDLACNHLKNMTDETRQRFFASVAGGPGSAGEDARLRVRNDELENDVHLLKSKVISLESELAELRNKVAAADNWDHVHHEFIETLRKQPASRQREISDLIGTVAKMMERRRASSKKLVH